MNMIRTFIALKLPQDILDRLGAIAQEQQRAPGGSAGQWVTPDKIHLTLKFLGDVPEQRIPTILSAVSNACNPLPPFDIRLAGLGCFPNARKPRVVWVGIDERTGQLHTLYRRIEEAMAACGFEAEKRPFRPHLTLARVAQRASRQQAELLGATASHRKLGTIGVMQANAVFVVKSTLHSQGAQYQDLFCAPLQGPPAPDAQIEAQ